MSLFDQPQKCLNPALFTADEKIRDDARLYIFEDVNKILQPGTVVGLYLLGSMAGRQYNENSDIDINLILRDGLDRENYKDYVKSKNERMLPGTTHPINYHVQNYTVPKYEATAEYAVYDLLHDTWAVPPKPYESIRNPEEEYRDEIRYSKMYAKSLKYKHDMLTLHEDLEKGRKQAYYFGWGTPRESQQNILYKYIEKITKK
ncbi:MAG: nucleotidyltransferase domain-containing protein [Candidatus Brocadiales bacterium]|nr:nucleotidyltransferase domain-containing protein [Candidatus Brocadiales bacterium]